MQIKNERYQTVPGPKDVVRSVLKNGIILLTRANFNSPSVVIYGSLTAGSVFDPDEKLGLADFTAMALKRGTALRNFYQIYDTLESSGAMLGFGCGVNTLTFSGKSLTEDLPLLLELLAELLRKPVFPGEEIEKLRTQILTGLAIRDQDTGSIAGMAFDEIVYDKHPYRRPTEGYQETIANITQSDLVDFHRKYYGPKGMVLVVVGGVDPSQAIAYAERIFGEWENPQQRVASPLPPFTPLEKSIVRKVIVPGKVQADINIGAAGPSSSSVDYLPASLGNSVLGQFGMMGRLGESIREKAGLAYDVYSSLSGGIGPGPWYVSAGVAPEDVDQVIDLILAEISQLVTNGVQSSELEDSQEQFISSMPLAFETNVGVASSLLNVERYQLGLDYFVRFPSLVRSVTPDDVLTVVKRYLHPEHLAIAVAGPEQVKP